MAAVRRSRRLGCSARRPGVELRPWEALTETQREPNRRFADDLHVKLALVNCMPMPVPDAPAFTFTDAESTCSPATSTCAGWTPAGRGVALRRRSDDAARSTISSSRGRSSTNPTARRTATRCARSRDARPGRVRDPPDHDGPQTFGLSLDRMPLLNPSARSSAVTAPRRRAARRRGLSASRLFTPSSSAGSRFPGTLRSGSNAREAGVHLFQLDVGEPLLKAPIAFST